MLKKILEWLYGALSIGGILIAYLLAWENKENNFFIFFAIMFVIVWILGEFLAFKELDLNE